MTPDTYRTRIYRHYVQARAHALAPDTVAGLAPRGPALQKLVRQHFPADRNAAVLDLGCGHGALLHFARGAGYTNLRGVDGSPQQVAAARRPMSSPKSASSNLLPPPVRVAHLVSHPIQYYVPVYRALSAFSDIDLTVYYLTDTGIDRYFDPGFGSEVRWDVDLLSGYTSEFLPSARGRSAARGLRQAPQMDVLRSLARGSFDVIWAHGYQSWTVLLARGLALLGRQGFLMRDDQTLLEPRSRLALLAKQAIFRYLFLDPKSRALHPGVNSRKHFAHFGVPAGKLRPAVHCVDNALFSQELTALRPRREELRRAFGIPDTAPVILFCGKLIEKKDPAVLLEAFARLRRAHEAWLLIVGDGPLMPELLAMRDRYEPGVGQSVLFAGFLNQSRMPEAYTAADMFVLPSRAHETWGLVINEAQQFSLPVVASDHVGCVPDLVLDDFNGLVFPMGSVDALTDCLTRLVANPQQRQTFGERGRDLVANYTIEACANQIRSACLEAAAR